jgi:hypothetical protein
MKRLPISATMYVCFVPALVYAQTGLFWDNSEQQRSNAGSGWDSGNRGTSALGQLESIAGRKVDTSRAPQASQPQRVQPKVQKRPALSMKHQVGLMVFESLFEQVLSSALSDNDAAANAQSLQQQRIAAELKRQEELRKKRILHAQWRAEWDERDQTTTDQLSNAFDPVPVSSSGPVHRSFFGTGGVDPKTLLVDVDLFANDTSVVDLRDATTFTVHPLNMPAPLPLLRGDNSQTHPVSASSTTVVGNPRDLRRMLERRIPRPAQWAAQWWWQEVQALGKNFLLERIPVLGSALDKFERLPGVSTAMDLYEKYEDFKELRDGLSEQNERTLNFAFGGAQDFIAGRGDANSYWDRFQHRTHEHRDDALQRSVNEVASNAREGLEGDEVDDYPSTVTPLNGTPPHTDTARWEYHKLSQLLSL